MAYWGGGGVNLEQMHPSLRTYIDCFESSPFPRMYPRGGGPHDQDPTLMRDFRTIREISVKLKDNQAQLNSGGVPMPDDSDDEGEDELEKRLNSWLNEMGDSGTF